MVTTSKGICVTGEFEDAVFYQTSSVCPCEDCNQSLWLEYDEEFKSVELQVEATFEHFDLFGFDWKSKSKSKLLYRIWHRIRVACGMLCFGTIKLRHYFMFKNEDIEDYIKALQEGYEKVKQFKKEQEDNKK